MSEVLDLAGRTAGWTLLLLVLRTAPIAIALPIFGGLAASPVVRTSAVLALCAVLWPSVPVVAPANAIAVVSVAASQLVFGLLTALGTMFVFEAARAAGAISDTVLGRGSFGAADPLGQAPSGPMATLHALLLLAVFAATGSHRLLIAGMHGSLELFALDAVLGADPVRALVGEALALLAGAFAAAVALALPALAVGFVVDVSLGWLGRTMPQFPALFIAMPLRMVLGWTVVGATLAGGMAWLVAAALEAHAAMVAAGG